LYAAVLTGICLYAACSCHEITEWKRPPGAARRMLALGRARELEEMTFKTRDEYREWLLGESGRDAIVSPRSSSRHGSHTSSPFVWLSGNDSDTHMVVGGCDDLLALAARMAEIQPEGHGPSKL
jgi:hypothetical protein